MRRAKKNISQIVDIVNCDGLCYAIQESIDPCMIEDEELVCLWATARRALINIEAYLDYMAGEDWRA